MESRFKIISKWLKTLLRVIYASFHFSLLFFSPGHKICWKQTWITHFASVAKDGLFWLHIMTSPQLTCDVMWMQGTGIVTSYLSIVIACANWHKVYFQWIIINANIDFLPPSIHNIACKKVQLLWNHRIAPIESAWRGHHIQNYWSSLKAISQMDFSLKFTS